MFQGNILNHTQEVNFMHCVSRSVDVYSVCECVLPPRDVQIPITS
jgi:hypothetical protein